MRSPSKNLVLNDRLTNSINKIIDDDGRGAIDGVEFDFRHEQLDQDQWVVLGFLDGVTNLPNEIEYGALHNQHALWFPWFGPFDDKVLRAKVAKLKPQKVEALLKEIVARKGKPAADENHIDRLVSFLTPAYLIESGDKLSICDIADVSVGGDHLHEHDRLIKRAWVQVTKADGTITKINEPYDIVGSHNIINAEKNGSDPFGSILLRIVRFLKLKEPSQLRSSKAAIQTFRRRRQ